MANSKVSKARALKIIQNVLLIVIGILIACSVIDKSIVQYIIGIALVVYGAFYLFRSVYDTKSFIMPFGVAGGILLGLGIATMCNDYAQLLGCIQHVIYVALIVIGGLLMLDSVIQFVQHRNNAGIFELIIGVILLVVGILFVAIPEMQDYCWIAFGVVLAVYGLYNLIVTLIKISKK